MPPRPAKIRLVARHLLARQSFILAIVATLSLIGLPLAEAAIRTWRGNIANTRFAIGSGTAPSDGGKLVLRPAGTGGTTATNGTPLTASSANAGRSDFVPGVSAQVIAGSTLTSGSASPGISTGASFPNAQTSSASRQMMSAPAANAGSRNDALPPSPSAPGNNDAFDTNPVATGGVANFSGNFTLGTTTPAAGGTGTPASGDALYFGTSSTTTLNDDLAAGTVFAGITFNAGASAFTIGGNAFTLSAGITNNSAANQTINNAVTLSADQPWLGGTANGTTLTLGGGVAGAGINLTTNGGINGPQVSTNTVFTGAVSLGSLIAQGNASNGPTYSSNPTTTFSGSSTLTTTGNVVVGRSNLVFAGSSSVNVAGSITNAGSPNADWANVVIQDTANVTAGSVNLAGNGVTGNLSLNGGTLTTGSIAGIDGESGFYRVRLRLNGTQIIASQSNAAFLTVAVSSNGGVASGATTTAYVGNGGALFNSNGYNIGVTANLANDTGATGFLTKSGLGTLTLSGTNTYTGTTTVSAGTVQLGNGGTTGSLSPSSAIIDNGIFVVNRSNALLQGTDFSSAAITGTGGFTQAGTGTTTLSVANTFTGPTTVNAGTLNLIGSLTSVVTVNSGGTLSGYGNGTTTGRIAGNLTVAGGGALALTQGNSSTPFTVNGALSLGGTGSYGAGQYSTLNFTLGNSVEALNASGALTLNSGGAYINLIGATTVGTYNLLTFASVTGTGSFSLSSTTAGVSAATVGRNTYTLLTNPGSVQLQVSGASIPGVAYFNGAVSSQFNDLSSATVVNFSTNLAGTTDAGNIPGATSDVILNASNAPAASTASVTLGASTTLNSLRVNGNGTTTLAADGSTLTINALADSNTASDGSFTGNTAGTGIAIAAGANAFTLSVPVVLGNSQTWTNGSANLFTLGGPSITGSATTGNTQTLTLANTGVGGTTVSAVIGDGGSGGKLALAVNNTGAGTTTLTGASTYTGGTTISGGTLLGIGLTALGANVAASNISIGSGAALTLQAPTGDSTYSYTFSGSGLLKITSPNSFGGVTLNNFGVFSGTLEIAPTGESKVIIQTAIPTNLSTATLLIDNGSQLVTGPSVNFGTIKLSGNGNNENRGAIRLSGNGTTNGVLGGNIFLQGDTTIGNEGGALSGNISPSVAGTTTLTMGTSNSNGAALLSGVLSNGTGTLALAQAAGTTTLSNANTFTGATTISGGSLRLTNALALQNSTVTNNAANGVVFDSSVTGNAFTVGALAGTANIILQNNAATPAPIALTVGASSGTYSGVLSGAGSLIQNGPGTQTLSGANTYTGGTTISQGTLALGPNGSIPMANLTFSGTGALGLGDATGSRDTTLTAPIPGTTAANAIVGNSSANSTVTLNGTGTQTYAITFGRVSGANTNNLNLVVGAPGSTATTVLTATSTYTGTTVVNGGTLTLATAGPGPDPNTFLTAGGTLAGTSGLTVNSGGTLILGASNTIGSGAVTGGTGNGGTGVTLAGGMLTVTSGVTQGQGSTVANGSSSAFDVPGLGNLTLTANSSLNFAGSSGTLVFNGLTLNGNALSIGGTHFATLTGDSADGTTDRLIVESDAGPLSATDLALITFPSYGNSPATDINLGDGFYEIIPLNPVLVPEPSTWAALLLGLGAFCYVRQSRANHRMFRRSR